MNNGKIKTSLAWLIIALSVFSTCLLFQTRYFLIFGLTLLFFTIILAIRYGWKVAAINVLISGAYLLFSRAPFVLFDPKVMTHFFPIVFLRQKIADFYDQIYTNNSFAASLFKLIILNLRDDNSKQVYYTLTEVSVIHMFVVSGFHLNLLFVLLTFWNKRRNTRFVTWGAFAVCLLYGVLLNLTFGILRSLITLFLGKVQRWRKISPHLKLAIAIFVVVFLNHTAVENFGFQMSCLGTLGCISGLKTKSKILDSVFTNLFAMILITPVIVCMSHRFNAISFIVIVLFAPLFYFLIVYTWLLSWLKWLVIVNLFVVNGFYYFFNLLASMKIIIVVQKIEIWYVIAYYWIVLTGFIFLNLKFEHRHSVFANRGLAIWN